MKQSYVEAISWWRKAANKGDPWAMHMIGAMYDHGHSVEPNKNEARKWYRKAADLGLDVSKVELEKLEKE